MCHTGSIVKPEIKRCGSKNVSAGLLCARYANTIEMLRLEAAAFVRHHPLLEVSAIIVHEPHDKHAHADVDGPVGLFGNRIWKQPRERFGGEDLYRPRRAHARDAMGGCNEQAIGRFTKICKGCAIQVEKRMKLSLAIGIECVDLAQIDAAMHESRKHEDAMGCGNNAFYASVEQLLRFAAIIIGTPESATIFALIETQQPSGGDLPTAFTPGHARLGL